MSKKITLFCSAGMSTSLLVNKMREEAKKAGKDYEINAYSLAEVPKYGPEADVVLLGPQVRFAKAQVEKQLPGKNIDVLDMRAYGMMDGAAAIKLAEKYL